MLSVRPQVDFRPSAERSDLLKSFIEKSDSSRASKPQFTKMCTTRFIDRHTSIVCVCSLLPFILENLDNMTTWQSSEVHMH